jgi:pleiotropic regulator 1
MEALIERNARLTRELFARTPIDMEPIHPPGFAARLHSEYDDVRELPAALAEQQASVAATAARRKRQKAETKPGTLTDPKAAALLAQAKPGAGKTEPSDQSKALAIRHAVAAASANGERSAPTESPIRSMVRSHNMQMPKPEWHAPWKLMRVISGHLGWVRALSVEPGNEWFASGAGDRTIKIWDLATGTLKLTLTGHISTVRGLAVSPRHPYLFSCGEDKMVKCWDLETNKVIRHYHGHLSGVYSLSIHPTLDVLVTGGRDGVARVWDMRTRSNIHVLGGHRATVADLKCQEADPQVITASLDSTIRLWDLAAGKTMGVLTHHKKGVRALAVHPTEFTFASGSTGSIKQWKCPEGAFMLNFEGQNAIINTLSANADNVLFSGGECLFDVLGKKKNCD